MPTPQHPGREFDPAEVLVKYEAFCIGYRGYYSPYAMPTPVPKKEIEQAA